MSQSAGALLERNVNTADAVYTQLDANMASFTGCSAAGAWSSCMW